MQLYVVCSYLHVHHLLATCLLRENVANLILKTFSLYKNVESLPHCVIFENNCIYIQHKECFFLIRKSSMQISIENCPELVHLKPNYTNSYIFEKLNLKIGAQHKNVCRSASDT